jgi:CRISPR type I-E-associated protein CasB/Cse2
MITTELPASSPGLASRISRLAQRLAHLGTGPLAELRRLRADAEDRWRSSAFYQLYVSLIESGVAGDPEERERRWAIIIAGMARLTHQSGRNAGATLAEHGFAERRLVRLLDADEDHLASELRAVVSYLSSKGASVNWTNLADLVISVGTDRQDAVRRTIAAAYYRTLATKKA